VRILLFAVIGLITGYYAGAFLACVVLWPEMNLCGLAGVFITGPLGLLAGILLGWHQSRAKARQREFTNTSDQGR
jgi:hypothetical protein